MIFHNRRQSLHSSPSLIAMSLHIEIYYTHSTRKQGFNISQWRESEKSPVMSHKLKEPLLKNLAAG